jgi:hypothetical protein
VVLKATTALGRAVRAPPWLRFELTDIAQQGWVGRIGKQLLIMTLAKPIHLISYLRGGMWPFIDAHSPRNS